MILIGVVGIQIVLLACTVGYDRVAATRERRTIPPPGRLVDAGGYNLHLYDTGVGSSTVVLEAGAGSWSIFWSRVQPEIASVARVVSYDRSGYGWSEARPGPPTTVDTARGLHTALHNANIPGPYILVGHSLGGLFCRAFAQLYPEEVAGMVLLDSAHEEQAQRLGAEWRETTERSQRRFSRLAFFADLGLLRFGIKANAPSFAIADEFLPAYYAQLTRSRFFRTEIDELSLILTPQQAPAVGSLGTKPLAVITAGDFHELAAYYRTEEGLASHEATWLVMQDELAELSSESRHLLVSDAGHNIPLERPEVAIRAITEIIDRVAKSMQETSPREEMGS